MWSEAQAKRNTLPDQQQSNCTRNYSSSGGATTFTFSCSKNGNTTSGTGEVRRSGDTITTIVDGTTSHNGASHTIHSETEMKYVGADCGSVKPSDSDK